MLTLRKISFAGLVVCIGCLLGAVFIENQYMVSPCPLCMLQRIVFGMLAVFFLLGTIFKFRSPLNYIYSFIIFLLSSLGLAIAWRQFWLQYYAPKMRVSCSASLERLIDAYPFLDALKIALRGSSECATVDFTIIGISLAGWAVILFGVFAILALYIMYAIKRYNLE